MMPFRDNIAGAIKTSSSAGPAFNANGECLGMAFQSLSSDSAENIGYVIPTVGTPLLRKVLYFFPPGMQFLVQMGCHFLETLDFFQVVIMHFLNDLLKHGSYTGFPTIGVETQTMENPHLREAFGMSPKQKGLLVNRIAPTCAVAKLLEVGDVLLSFDKEPIANDGTVVYRKHERVAFSSLAQESEFRSYQFAVRSKP